MELKSYREKLLDIVRALISIIILCLGFFVYEKYLAPDFEQLKTEPNQIVLTECRYPFGSWFNKDSLTINQQNIQFHKRSFWGDKKITIPFSKINSVVFKDGIKWKSISFQQHRFFPNRQTIFFKNPETKKILKNIMMVVNPDFIVVEKVGVLKKLISFFKSLL